MDQEPAVEAAKENPPSTVEEVEEDQVATPGSDNPLALKETNIASHKGNVKKKKKPVAAKEKSSALDLINARLKELQETEIQAQEEAETDSPQLDPHESGLMMFQEGGEQLLREGYQKLIQETKKFERDMTILKRKGDQLAKEKERLHVSLAEAKAGQQRSQIKCLELQKQIKTLKEAAEKMEAEKEAQRNELEGKFQTAIDEITAKLEDGNTEREGLRKENTELEEKLKSIEEECGERFDRYQTLHEEKAELLQERKAQQKEEEENAMSERHKNQLLEQALLITTRSCMELRAQIKMYEEKMEEFEDSIAKSKDVFGTFGKELVKMKDHCDALQASRDADKTELTTLEKSIIDLNSDRIKYRKLIEQQITTNTKQKEAASRLSAKRNTWKPFIDSVAKWLESQGEAEEPKTAEEAK
eukprot:TRINITY_DN23539_c0_g1_i2.p1 TRINITY_DN23539_c0_g1~~TRINITY_DN23539_c0_g1_i2.p1  ORF type:complete len:431 (+),score=172.47 TRINITY_DN23539_c0_g1_i2:43-1293(+)